MSVWLRTLGAVMVGPLTLDAGELVRGESWGPATRRVLVRVGPTEGWVDAGDLEVAEAPPTALERLVRPEDPWQAKAP